MTTPNDPTALRQQLEEMIRQRTIDDWGQTSNAVCPRVNCEATQEIAFDLLACVEELEAERDGLKALLIKARSAWVEQDLQVFNEAIYRAGEL